MLNKGDGVLLCVSGGPDSVALFILFNILRKEYGLKLHVAHVNHMLRGEESDKDQESVEALSKKYGIPLDVKKINIGKIAKTKKKSLEETARDERYDFFLKLAQEKNLDKIAIAHNKDDQAETVLMRLLRGAGLWGLSGINPVRKIDSKYIIRPLVDAARNEIENFLKTRKITPRQDSSNKDPAFLRNKIRLKLLPLLEKEYNPNIKQILSNTSDVLRADYDFIFEKAKKTFNKIAEIKSGAVALKLKELDKQPESIKRQVLRFSIERLKGDVRKIDYRHWEKLNELILEEKTSSAVDLPGGVSVKKAKKSLVFLKRMRVKKEKPAENKIVSVKIPGETKFGPYKVKTSVLKNKNIDFYKKPSSIEYFDLDKLSPFIYLRYRKPKDKIRPFGMKGKKKLQDLFVDEKTPRQRRDKIPLVLSKRIGIIWVCGVKRSDFAKVVNTSKRILKIEIKKVEFFSC